MPFTVTIARRTAYGLLAAGAACAALAIPSAGAEPVDDCNASGLSATISSVTTSLSEYFAAHPDESSIDRCSRQPAFIAVGQFDGYFADHPQEADEVRAIKQPLIDYQNRCGMQVIPAEALAVLSELRGVTARASPRPTGLSAYRPWPPAWGPARRSRCRSGRCRSAVTPPSTDAGGGRNRRRDDADVVALAPARFSLRR